jgi:HD-GYP domain-containing protein (c-di-GMP phosphodiesterase class II)
MNSWWLAAEIYHEIIECLVTALEAKDAYTKGHSTRVADLAYRLGELAGLQGDALEDLHLAAHLHDIGKIGTPDQILNKKTPLLSDEELILRQHPVIGYQILARSSHLIGLATIVRHHHERWDGSGYPDGLRGTEIPFGSRIITVCDAIDAMTSARPYRPALSAACCLQELESNRGRQFDPNIMQLMAETKFSVYQADVATTPRANTVAFGKEKIL